MGTGLVISSVNYDGQNANITYYPDTGGTVNIGIHLIPYTFELDYYYGSYELYFLDADTTCYTYISNPDTNYLLQEDYSTLDQENNSKILIT